MRVANGGEPEKETAFLQASLWRALGGNCFAEFLCVVQMRTAVGSQRSRLPSCRSSVEGNWALAYVWLPTVRHHSHCVNDCACRLG